MSRLVDSIRNLSQKEDVIINAICLVMALLFFGLAAGNLKWAGDFLTTDALFVVVVFGMLGTVLLISPVLWLYKHGYFAKLVGSHIDTEPVEMVPVHFEGTTKLFLSILGWLLGLTLIEVLLAYKQVPIVLMLTILIGLSLIKAALIIAYFMHLKFERLSLVLSLIPALVICICLFFIFFPDSARSKNYRYGATPATEQGQKAEP
ncbi:MAG: cytochrome C oxidase subunit IV family protein [Acidobacteria bacterium]|nr:cytochrome C oxidase subunit IV family protein [Acidobacteriota bacterium]